MAQLAPFPRLPAGFLAPTRSPEDWVKSKLSAFYLNRPAAAPELAPSLVSIDPARPAPDSAMQTIARNMIVFKISDKADGSRILERPPGQACDACKLRKLKCDRAEPCEACQSTDTACSYAAMPRRKGRPPAARRLRLEKQRTKSTPAAVEISSSAEPTPSTSIGSYDLGQASHESLPTSYLTPGVISQTSEHFAADDCLSEPLEFSATTPNPPASWQQVSEYPSISDSCTPATMGEPRLPFENTQQRTTKHPLSVYTHWTRVFLMRLYPVFPVIDPGCLLSKLSLTRDAIPRSMARFFAAMSACVIAQLNMDTMSTSGHGNMDLLSGHATPSHPHGTSLSVANKYIAQCTAERQDMLFIEEADEWTIMESFFTFAYYGQLKKSKRAWYYLREAMGFAVSLGLDREESYCDPDLEVNERKRRLFWLLFITERAFCLQHRTSATLQASIALPRIYDGCDEATLTGFISLITLFLQVDSAFVASWCTQSIKGDGKTISKLLDPDAARHVMAIDETQRADISVTQCWLHTLAWRLRNQANAKMGGGGSAAAMSLRKAARSLLSCFSNTRRDAIESHGIGMEQKLSDIAGFMCDLLPTLEQTNLTADTDSIPNLLHNFMCLLANFRNQESCYLGPLAEKATVLLMIHGALPTDHEPCLDLNLEERGGPSENDGEPEWTDFWEDF